MGSEPDETRLEEARGYLAEYLADEDIHGGESRSWFGELAEYAMQLPPDDPLITRTVVYLQPFLDDDERVEGAMYPGGEAVRFIEQGWGGDLGTYLAGFVEAMGRSWQPCAGCYSSGRRTRRKPSRGACASSVSVLRAEVGGGTSAALLESQRTIMGGGNGARRNPRHHPAHAVRGPVWQGKVALQISWPPFRLQARGTSTLAASVAAASAIRDCSCRSPSAEVAGAGYSRIGWTGRYAAALARIAVLRACSAIHPRP
jgi:hypothetical protein